MPLDLEAVLLTDSLEEVASDPDFVTGTLGALGGAGMVAPQAAIGAGVGLGAASIPYAPYVQGGLARLLASRPELLQQIAPYVNALAPAASAAGGPVAASMFAR